MASTAESSSSANTRSRVVSSSRDANKSSVRVTNSSEVTSTEDSTTSVKRREVLVRQPSYCKILDDLQGTEAKVARMKQEDGLEQTIEVSTSDDAAAVAAAAASVGQNQPVQTITINGQQYQIVSPSAIASESVQTITVGSSGGNASSGSSSSPPPSGVVQYAATSQNGQTMFIQGTVATAATPQVITVGAGGSGGSGSSSGGVEEATRKREIRLLKNREAARECRNKKKEYIKCLENRVAVLENQNKALIEELKSLKELYTGQKS